ncbi:MULTISPECIES: hypothetical protein [Brevundimonas]|uniref:hypothetical protein n=1 Tax=Brevundimonas TaxID=41275 RepID=UPI000F02F2A6|nr:hypothetical protein [Brevundimonas lutea]
MSLTATLIALALVACLGLFSAWRGARPLDVHRGPRMMPWRFLMLLSVVAAIFLLVHLLNLAGATTGPEVMARR